MIKFFRKIRYNLMDTGKTGKYFKYAIGEIVLVVIGILIALQINTWNEQRRQVQAEQEFLEGIKNDLQQDKEYIQWVLTKADEKLNAFEQLNEALPKHQRDSLLKIYLFEGQRTFYPVSGSFESAVAGNEINRYKNKTITQSLIKLYNSTYSRLIDNGQIVDERWSNLSEKHIHERRVKHFEDLDEASYPLLLDDIYFHFIQLSWYKNTLNNAIVEIDKILQHIDD